MSKKERLKFLTDSRTHRIIFDKKVHCICYICQRRSGSKYADCNPSGFRAKGYHGNGKYIYPYKWRAFKTWKYNRKKQYKN